MESFKYLFLFICGFAFAQTHSESIADPVVATHKTAISTALGVELSLRKKQGDLIKDLEDTEEDYDSKRNVFGNFKTNTIVVAAVQAKLVFLNQKVANIESTINTLKVASFGFGQGLSRYQDQLEIEKRYLQKLQEESVLIGGGGMLVSGGTGHVYTAYLKLLIRLIRVKNNILKIDKEIAAKNKVVTTLKRLTSN